MERALNLTDVMSVREVIAGVCARSKEARNALRMYLVWFQAMVEVDARAISRAHDRQRAKVPWAHAACESVGASWHAATRDGNEVSTGIHGWLRAGTPHAP
jgi:hypothetical protein